MGTLRGLITLALLLSFLGVVVWSLRGANKERFDAAARLPLEDLPQANESTSNSNRNGATIP